MAALNIWTFGEAKAFLQRVFGVSADTTLNAMFDKILDSAVIQVGMDLGAEALYAESTITTVAGTESYALADDCFDLDQIDDDTYRYLRPGDYREARENEQAETGYVFYTVRFTKSTRLWSVYLYPTPTSAATLNYGYYGYPALMTAAGDEPEIPVEVESAWLYLACCMVQEYNPSGITLPEQSWKRQVYEDMMMKAVKRMSGKGSRYASSWIRTGVHQRVKG